jgi:hypothetical protein
LKWSVEGTAEFDEWWESLEEEAQDAVDVIIGMLEEVGPRVPYPYSSAIRGSRYGALRELRIQHRGRPLRVLYAFDPRRVAVLLLGDDKGGSKRWYRKAVARADSVFDGHLEDLKGGG